MIEADGNSNNTNNKIIFKNFGPFTYCISEIDKTQIMQKILKFQCQFFEI